MNSVDASEHYELLATGSYTCLQLQKAQLKVITNNKDLAPSLLTVIIDTNPHAWALLEDSLPLSKAVANILVFINAHLACNYANEVAVVASHSQKAAWLYPSQNGPNPSADQDGDVTMNGSTTPQTKNTAPSASSKSKSPAI